MEADAAKFLAVGLAGLGMFGAGIGLGILGSGAMNALGRNPEAKDAIAAFRRERGYQLIITF